MADDIQGANLALMTRLEQRQNLFRARLELWDTARPRLLGVQTVEAPLSKPFDFLDELYLRSAVLAGLTPRRRSPTSEYGVRGAGTLRFLLQGIGRVRGAESEAQARRGVDDLELACRTEPEAASARAWLANAEFKTFTLAYAGGEKYPHLEREEGEPDRLADISKPRSSKEKESSTASK